MVNNNSTNLAIFWDLENVTPSSSDTLFIEGLMDYAEGLGRLLTSFAYAEWNKPAFSKLGPPLSARHFKLIHVPRERKGKNSADMQLVSDALELLQFYQHIDTYILITGDSDFRPLLLSLRKSGKKIHVICDSKTAAQDLLALADQYTDYRDLLPNPDTDNDDDDEQETLAIKSPEYWFERLVEATKILKSKGKSCSFGSVKIRMRLLNPEFDETLLGYKMFKQFVTAAAKKGYVSLVQTEDGSRQIDLGSHPKDNKKDTLQEALQALQLCLKEMGDTKDGGYHYFGEIGIALKQKGIDLPSVGFVRLTKFMMMAEKRDVIEIKRDSTSFYARLKQYN